MISAEQEQKCFPCIEPGCGQVVSIENERAVGLQTTCASGSVAFSCPGCGRLYWGSLGENRGKPVMNRRYEKAFCKDGNMEHKPLLAGEKSKVLQGLIAECQKEEAFGFLLGHVGFVVSLGHAPDCPTATDEGSPCTCGISDAKEFIAKEFTGKQPDE